MATKISELVEYIKTSGSALVPSSHPHLGTWIDTQRQTMKKGKLSEDRIHALNSIGFVWDKLEYEWQERYKELVEYIEINGNALIPRNHPTLGDWSSTVRTSQKRGKLSDERLHLLESIGFIWDQTEYEWQEKYEQLVQYAKESGNTLVLLSHPELGPWVSDQRQTKRRGKLSNERIKLLDEIGFIWDHTCTSGRKDFKNLNNMQKNMEIH